MRVVRLCVIWFVSITNRCCLFARSFARSFDRSIVRQGRERGDRLCFHFKYWITNHFQIEKNVEGRILSNVFRQRDRTKEILPFLLSAHSKDRTAQISFPSLSLVSFFFAWHAFIFVLFCSSHWFDQDMKKKNLLMYIDSFFCLSPMTYQIDFLLSAYTPLPSLLFTSTTMHRIY